MPAADLHGEGESDDGKRLHARPAQGEEAHPSHRRRHLGLWLRGRGDLPQRAQKRVHDDGEDEVADGAHAEERGALEGREPLDERERQHAYQPEDAHGEDQKQTSDDRKSGRNPAQRRPVLRRCFCVCVRCFYQARKSFRCAMQGQE